MFRNLPSLTGLRTFEAAARLGSFKRAAEELGVTPAAVAAQIQSLEEWFGVPLFQRHHRRVEATAVAMRLQPVCHVALSTLLEATKAVEAEAGNPALTIGVGTLFASRWLSPRLSDFWLTHPQIALRLTHAPSAAQIADAGIDAMIAWGGGSWRGIAAEFLFRPTLVPVASPKYVQRRGRPESPAELLGHVLVHELDTKMWRDWFTVHGVAPPRSDTATIVRDSVLALQLALDGQAIVLGVNEFLEEEFASGELLRLFEPGPSGTDAYFLALPPRDAVCAPLQAFRRWILAQAESTVAASASQ